MSEIIHAPAAYAFRLRDMTVQLLLPDEGQPVVDLALCYEALGKPYSLRMLPTDGFTANESYSLYSATVPGEHLAGESFCYRFSQKGITGERYDVPLRDLPVLPTVVITEFCPELPEGITYLELCNPRDGEVDLYDYELLLEIRGRIVGRNPLANAKGAHILKGGELALLYYRTAALLQKFGGEAQLDTAFWRVLSTAFPANCEDIAEHPPKCFAVDVAQKTSEGYAALSESFSVYQTCSYRMLLVPRGGGSADVLYAFDVSMDELCLDVPVATVALYGIDICAPKQAIRLATKRQGTPALPDAGQATPFVGDPAVPAILPLEMKERVMLGAGDLCVRFAVLGGSAGCPTVWVKTAEDYTAYPAELTTDGLFEAVIPNDVLVRLGAKLCYYIEVTGGCYTARLGNAAQPFTRRITDNAGPKILHHYPAQGQAIEYREGELLCVKFFDGAGVNLRTSVLCFDGLNVSSEAKWSENEVTYAPKRCPAQGEHTFELTLRDTLGNRTYRRTAFVVTDGKELQFYRGEVHSHTVDSDARGTIEQAMLHARDVGKVDFFAVTDHCVYLEPQDILRQKKVADRFDQNGRFTTLYGYEVSWGKRGFWGHMNVLGGEQLFYAPHTTMPQLFQKLEENEGVIAQFNHPCDDWGDFGNFACHNDEIDRRVCLQEVKRLSFDDHYALSLARGWHVSPTYNEDNHGADWTTRTKGTTVVLAHSLTRENIMAAMRARRTYATLDNTMRISYRVNGEWLGARLKAPSKLSVEIRIVTEREEGIGRVMLVAEDNIVVATMEAGIRKSICWELELAPDFDYYYVKVQNGSLYTVTAPVFVESRESLVISALQQGTDEQDELPFAACATVENRADAPITDVSVSFYLTPKSGFDLERCVPLETVHVGRIEPGEAHTVCRAFPLVAGHNRITALVSGQLGKHRVADTGFLLVSPVIVNRICALTSPDKNVENPYPYIEICNQTSAALALDGYQLRVRHEQGTHRPHSLEYLPLDGIRLAPKSHLVIWCRPKGAALGAEDFNARYATALVEGQDLLITEQMLILADEAGHPTDFCYGELAVSRAYYGSFCRIEDPVADLPLFFAASQDMTVCEQRISPATLPPLAALSPEQQLPLMNTASRRQEIAEEKKAKERERVVSKLTKKPLIPVQTAALVANAVASLRHLLSEKE